MKTIILLLILTTVSVSTFAQQDSVIFEYCFLMPSESVDARVIHIKLDFGIGTDAPLEYLRDPETGKPMKFNSVVDALNYLGKKGWELVSVTALSTTSYGDHQYFLKRRRVIKTRSTEK